MSGSVVDDLLPSGTFKEGRRGTLGSSSLHISTKSGTLPSPSASPISWALPFTVPYYLSWTGLYMPLIMATYLILSVGTSSCPSELFSPALPEKTCFLKDPCILEEGQVPDLHSNPSISWALEVLNSKVELKTLRFTSPQAVLELWGSLLYLLWNSCYWSQNLVPDPESQYLAGWDLRVRRSLFKNFQSLSSNSNLQSRLTPEDSALLFTVIP